MSLHESELEYVGFWARVGAAVIDTIIILIVTLPLLAAIYGADYWTSERLVHGPADLLLSYVFPAVFAIGLWLKFAATPGKMAFNATVVDARTGARPTLGQCVIRYIGYFVAMLPLMLGIIWVGFDPRKQGWHDKMAGTVVVRRKGGAADPVRFGKA